MPDTALTGQIKRAVEPGMIEGYLTDARGWIIIRLIGTRDPGGGYNLSGVLGDPPASLRITTIDDVPGEPQP